jgi:hypothetical protein
VDRAHIAWPFQLDRNGHILTVEQDSDQDVASCIATCVLWPLGTRRLNLQFGISNPLFRQGGPDLDEIRTQLMLNDSRAVDIVELDDQQLTDFLATVTVGFDQTTDGGT